MIALLRKEFLVELRSREILATALLTGVLQLVVLSFAFDPTSPLRGEAAPGAFWVTVVFSGVLALGRSFVSEKENDCLQGLLLAPVDRGTLYLSKVVAQTVLLLCAQALLVPLFVVFFDLTVGLHLLPWLLSLVLVAVGFSAAGVLLSAIAAQTRAKEILLPLLLVPLAVPLFLAGLRISQRVFAQKPLGDAVAWIHLAIGFDMIVLVVGWLLFEYVVED